MPGKVGPRVLPLTLCLAAAGLLLGAGDRAQPSKTLTAGRPTERWTATTT